MTEKNDVTVRVRTNDMASSIPGGVINRELMSMHMDLKKKNNEFVKSYKYEFWRIYLED
jgi:hypothetical protein